MKKPIIALNLISLLSIFYMLTNGINIVGGADGVTHLEIPVNEYIIITPILVIFTLAINLYWIIKK